jgi:hypothetical protein
MGRFSVELVDQVTRLVVLVISVPPKISSIITCNQSCLNIPSSPSKSTTYELRREADKQIYTWNGGLVEC